MAIALYLYLSKVTRIFTSYLNGNIRRVFSRLILLEDSLRKCNLFMDKIRLTTFTLIHPENHTIVVFSIASGIEIRTF